MLWHLFINTNVLWKIRYFNHVMMVVDINLCYKIRVYEKDKYIFTLILVMMKYKSILNTRKTIIKNLPDVRSIRLSQPFHCKT